MPPYSNRSSSRRLLSSSAPSNSLLNRAPLSAFSSSNTESPAIGSGWGTNAQSDVSGDDFS